MIRLRSFLIAMFVILTLAAAGPIQAEELPTKLTLHPAAEPTPALKYRLLPSRMDQISGNAAVHYGKVTAEETTFFGKQEWRDKVYRWEEMPLADLLLEQVNLPSGSIFFLEQGARCKYCDWQLPFGEVPFYRILLPEAQQTRHYARILHVKARQEIVQGKFDDAVKTFQTGFALGRNVAEGETLVNGLVGIAICHSVMTPAIFEFIQQPEAPNLYWALTMLPTPLIDMQRALEIESNGVELSFPELNDLANARHTPDEWRELFHRFTKQLTDIAWTGDKKPPIPAGEEIDRACEAALPAAKRGLIASGIPAEKVEQMPLHQIALLHTLRQGHELFDEGTKYYGLPFPQAKQGIDAATERAARARQDGSEIIPVVSEVLPAIWSTRTAVARTDRQIAVLRVFEALRIHGAKHDGKLPDQLSDITEVPIPDDPVTGKPFVYRLESDKAIVEGPALPNAPLNYEITMVPPK